MMYDKKCVCCDAKFTIKYSGESYLETLKKDYPKELNNYDNIKLNNLILSIEKGNPYMAISMEEVPNIICELQEAYKEYQKVQGSLKKPERLENKVNLNAQNS